MKRLIIAIAILAIGASIACADWLVCNAPPSEQRVTHYKVYDNGAMLTDNSPAYTDGSLRHDLGVIDDDLHIYTAEACNIRGCSAASDPFVFPSVAGQPQNTRWTKEL
jgi:hypothetical protein